MQDKFAGTKKGFPNYAGKPIINLSNLTNCLYNRLPLLC